MSRSHAVTRVLGAVALAWTLSVTGAAGAYEGQGVGGRGGPPSDIAPQYRAVPSEQPPVLTLTLHRPITTEVVVRDDRLILRGHVEDWTRGKVVVQRSACSSCRWRSHDVTRTGSRNRFRSQISAPRRGSTFWRARVAAADGYARSYSATWETYY